MGKLTKRTIDAAQPSETETFLWDEDLPGFGLRIFPSGRKSYLLQYRAGGHTRRITLGMHGPVTPDRARQKALALLGTIAEGNDPAQQKKAAPRGLTVAELCDLYVKEGMSLKKPSTAATDRGRIERHIKPLLGARDAASLTLSDVQQFVADVSNGKTAQDVKTRVRGRARVRGGGGTAARTVGLLGGIFTFGIKSHNLRADNPVRGVAKRKDARRVRFLSQAEFRRLGDALRSEEDKGGSVATAVIRLLVLTGCRRSEILGLKWEFVDWERRHFQLPDSKTGQKTVHVPSEAISLLRSVPRRSESAFVFAASDPRKHYVGLQKDWARIRRMADLPDVRIHDLRHAFASAAAARGHNLLMIGAMLGHRDPRTTQIYAHLTDNALQQAVGETGGAIASAMDGQDDETSTDK